MEAESITTVASPCAQPLPENEVPMINTIAMCLGNDHRKLNERIMRLALAAARLARDPDDVASNRHAAETWDEIQRDLWPHLQIEDSLLFSWGRARHALSEPVLDELKTEREDLRNLIATLPKMSSEAAGEPQPPTDGGYPAQTWIALARTLDSHVERFDREILPLILRALFNTRVSKS
ncbi:MAG TPA: hemerythrin domain-containing protein [Candidatus Binataceae bacterium]|nr:hemerythrin domain-containing protein [Candidatus Binataceae bacterium]